MTTKIDGLPPPARAAELAPQTSVRARAGEDRSAAVEATPAADSLRLTGEAEGLQAMQRELGSAPGIDVAKVNEIRSALADGSYRIDAQQVADRMLALENELTR